VEPAGDAGYAVWASDWPDAWIALDAAQTTAFELSICAYFLDQLDPAQRRCVRTGIDGARDSVAEDDLHHVTRGIDNESNRLSPAQARNRLVFAACVAAQSPLDWQVAEYLALWSEQAQIPFTEFQAILRKHRVREPDRI
jgi:hypothetical protein